MSDPQDKKRLDQLQRTCSSESTGIASHPEINRRFSETAVIEARVKQPRPLVSQFFIVLDIILNNLSFFCSRQ